MTKELEPEYTELDAGPSSATPGSRRAFLTGATAAGISAIVASQVPEASALTGTSRQPPVKMVACLRRRPDLSPAEFYDYWLHQHAPLARKLIQQMGGTRYVQSHTRNRDLGLLLATSRGQVLQAFDGIVEVWFPSRRTLVDSLASPAGARANLRLAQDEMNFIDLPRSSYFLTTEHVILG